MNKDVAEAIVAEANRQGYDINIYEGYSGRFMYGSETTGITYEYECDFLECVIRASIMVMREECDESPLSLDDFIEEVTRLRKDSLGKSTTIAY